MKRVGIFSGTFDPVHEGHLQFAREAQARCGLDKVFFLVEPRPRRKQGVREFEHRRKMVDLAIADEPGLGSIVLEQSRFTPHETLPLLQARFKGTELLMLMGDDMLEHLSNWPHVDELIKAVHFVIGTRNGKKDVDAHVRSLEKTRGISFRYTTYPSRLSSASSSNVRTVLRRGQTPTAINPKVLAYIRQHKLYAPVSAAS